MNGSINTVQEVDEMQKSDGSLKKVKDITPVLYLSDRSFFKQAKIARLFETFDKAVVAAPFDKPEVMERVYWYKFDEVVDRNVVWNQVMDVVETDWVLFLVDDEIVHNGSLPDVEKLDPTSWPAALIQWRENKVVKQCYQMRLVLKADKQVFFGKNIPDCTPYVIHNDISISDNPLFIFRETSLYHGIEIEEELSVARPSPQVYLALGVLYMQEGKYVHASAQYRKLLKMTQLMSHDRLAAFNGLAASMAEQFKWQQAVEYAVESIRIQSRQRLPYLILFRIHQLAKRWKEAHDILREYYANKDCISAASFDKVLPAEEALVQLADMAFRAGLREDSYAYYKQLYTLRDGKVASGFLERLLLFAIEQEDYNRSCRFFNELFGCKIPGELNEEQEEQLFEYLTLFMQRGWYEFSAGIYQELLEHDPTNDVYMRRWLVTLSKSKDIGKAQKVVSRIKAKKKTG